MEKYLEGTYRASQPKHGELNWSENDLTWGYE